MADAGDREGVARLVDITDGRVAPRLRPAAIAGLASLDIAWQTLARLPLRALEGEVLPAVVSFVVGGIVSLGIAPAALSVPLYGYLVYVLTPVVFPDTLRHVTERRGFRLLTAGHAALVPLLLYSPLPSWSRLAALVGLVVLPGYLLVVQRRRLVGPGGYPIAFLNAFEPSSNLQREYHDDPHVERRTPRFWAVLTLFLLAAVVLTVLLFLILGGLLALLSLMYPVPELLLVCWAGYRGLLASRLGAAAPDDARVRFDLETRLVTIAGVATDGIKGFVSVVLASIGLIVPVFLLYVGIYTVGDTWRIITSIATAGDPARQLGAVVGVVTIITYGVYGVWYWVRQLSRVPHALRAWRARLPTEFATPPDREFGPVLARPPGYFLPAAGVFVSLAVMMTAGDWPDAPRIPPAVFLVWLGAIVATWWSAYRALAGEPQPAISDQRALPAAFLIHVVGLWLWVDLGSGDSLVLGVYEGRIQPAAFLAALGQPTSLFVLLLMGLLLYFFYLPDVAYLREAADRRRLAFVPFFGGGILVFAPLVLVAPGLLRLLTGGIALLLLAALAVGIWEELQTTE